MRDPKLFGGEISSSSNPLKFKALIDNSPEQKNHAYAVILALNAELIQLLQGHELARKDQQGEIFPVMTVASHILYGMQVAMLDLGKAIKLKEKSNKNPLHAGLIDRYQMLVKGSFN